LKTALLIGVLGAILALAVWGLIHRFEVTPSDISVHGWIAMIAGGVLSLALAGGLMFLTFYSARRGYDDRPPRFDEE
jgi:hypothetical protein